MRTRILRVVLSPIVGLDCVVVWPLAYLGRWISVWRGQAPTSAR